MNWLVKHGPPFTLRVVAWVVMFYIVAPDLGWFRLLVVVEIVVTVEAFCRGWEQAVDNDKAIA